MNSIQTKEILFPKIAPLETHHLILREITEKDQDEYFLLCSNPVVMNSWGTRVHQSIEETRYLIQILKTLHEEKKMIRWGIIEKKSLSLIGDVGFWRFVPERFRAEVGAKLQPQYWSKGYMSQALSRIVEFGFTNMNLHSVEANVDPLNHAAIRLVRKVGFTQEGIIREHSFLPSRNQFIDTALFSVVQGKWSPQVEI